VTGDSISQVKQAIRERVWELLEREHVTEPGVRGYIPAFAGTEIAAGLLAGTPEWEAARVIKAVPDRDWMGDQLRLWTTTARTEVREPRLEMLSSPLVRLLEAADGELRDEIVAGVGRVRENVLGCLMPRCVRRSRPPGGRRGSMWSRTSAPSESKTAWICRGLIRRRPGSGSSLPY